MHRKIWLTLTSIILLITVGGIGITNDNSHAAHVYHSRIHRRSRSNDFRSNKSATFKRIPTSIYQGDLLYCTLNGHVEYTSYYFNHRHYQTRMSKGYIQSVINHEYQSINRARRTVRDRPLIKNQNLIHLANQRAVQAKHHFTHYNQDGKPLAWLDAEQMKLGSYRYNRRNIGENMFFVGKLSQVTTDHGLAGYYFRNPADLANDNVYDSLNNDAGSHWSHGENIMAPQHRYVGIGTYYRRSDRSLYVLVEFSSKRPVVHRK